MYLIEYINEELDIVLRQSFKNVKEFLDAIYKLPSSLAEVQMKYDSSFYYVDASAFGTLICRCNVNDIYVALSLKGVLDRYEVYENLLHTRAWEKLWIKPDPAKVHAFLNLSDNPKKLLPSLSAFRVNGELYSIDDLEKYPQGRLLVLKEAPGKIFEDLNGDVKFFADIADFETIEVFISHCGTAFSVLNYAEATCPPL